MSDVPEAIRQIRSLVTDRGQLELSLATVPVPSPGAGELLVRVEAAPINPSDLGLLLAAADLGAATSSGSANDPLLTAPIPEAMMPGLAARVGESMTVGNEGAGTVVAVGEGADPALIGRVVGFAGGSSYSQYRVVPVMMSLALPYGVTAVEGASCFVNPLTALGMVETMRAEGHTGIVHTAAASNLGQMLVRICQSDGVPLVNVVRRPEHVGLLQAIGAEHVCDSSSPSFRDDLTAAIGATGATIAFDAIGGGSTGSTILACMEAAAVAKATEYSRYGSDTFKQLYIYGGLDRGPTELTRNFGFSWSIAGWLLTPFLAKAGLEVMLRLRQRVSDEITTTFASHYTDEVTLAGALDLVAMRRYARMSTGEKFLIRPNA